MKSINLKVSEKAKHKSQSSMTNQCLAVVVLKIVVIKSIMCIQMFQTD